MESENETEGLFVETKSVSVVKIRSGAGGFVNHFQ